jgi:uncharacterized protein YceK
MLKIISIAAAAAVLSGCAGFSSLTAPGAAGTANAKQVVDNLNAFNEALKNGPCNGWGNLDLERRRWPPGSSAARSTRSSVRPRTAECPCRGPAPGACVVIAGP